MSASDSSQPRRFVGKTALITGASSRGIGGAIAERLAAEGARLSLLSRSEPERLLKRLSRLDVEVHWQSCDVTDAAQVASSIADFQQRFETLDVLINNAGMEIANRLEDFGDAWRDVVNVNLNGAIALTQATLPLFGGSGVIVNMASALALGGCTGYSIYSATKAGLVGLTQSLAWELAPRKIRVVAVAPALVATPMIQKHVATMDDQALQQIQASHPLGVGATHDVATAVAFLASSEARWITGITLPLGWTPGYPLPTAGMI